MTSVPGPLDEYPIHQVPLPLDRVPASDRNFYDRWYFNAHRRDADLFLVTGMGVYPNLGVIDAYAVLRRGGHQHITRYSDALEHRSLDCSVGGYRVEVEDPLRRLRVICEGEPGGLGFDLTWEASLPAVQEQPHVMRTGARAILDASRFAQVGTWAGELWVDDEVFTVDPGTWVGTRDRSWGIRPVGEAEPQGRSADEPLEGFWWLYVPLRFDDFAIVVLVQELPDGYRTLNDAVRVWPDGRLEQLGWPEVTIAYTPGTRMPERVRLVMRDSDGRPLEVTVEALTHVVLHAGAGYGGDPDWTHGQWRGRDWTSSAVVDLADESVAALTPFGVIDHVGRARCGGAEGWGLFEHGTMGRHDPSGFADWGSVAG